MDKQLGRVFNKYSINSVFIFAFSFILVFLIWVVILIQIIIVEVLRRIIFLKKKSKQFNPRKDLVSVTIANWNSKDHIEKCLTALRSQRYSNIELVVVDNNSSDGSCEYISDFISSYFKDKGRLIRNRTNLGFSKAHNQAFKLVKGEYVLPLNFDVFLSDSFIHNMVMMMRDYKNVGIASGKIFSNITEQKKTIDTTGVRLNNLFCCDRGQGEDDNGQYNSLEYIFGASGCAPFYRKEMLEDVYFNNEYFDETFNTYVEDVDLSWRAQLKGWRCLYNPQAQALHLRGATRNGEENHKKKINKDYFIIGFRNRYLMILKNINLIILLRKLHLLIPSELKFWFYSLSNDKWFYINFIFKFLILSPIILSKRAVVHNSLRVNYKEIEKILF